MPLTDDQIDAAAEAMWTMFHYYSPSKPGMISLEKEWRNIRGYQREIWLAAARAGLEAVKR